MTTLVAVQTKDDVLIGWDSLSTSGSEQSVLVNPKGVVNNNMVFLVAGSTLGIDLVEELEIPDYDGSDPRKWMIRNVAPRLRTMFAENEENLTDGKGRVNIGLIGVVGGQAFEFDSTFSPTQNTDGIYTQGSGANYASGALHVLKAAGITQEDLLLALEAAASLDAYTGGSFTVGSARKYIESGL